MNAPQQPEIRTSNGATAPTAGEKRPEVQPSVSFWDIREVRESRWGKIARAAVRDGLLPLGAVTVGTFTVRELLRSEGMDSGFKVVGVIAVIQALVILGMATLLVGNRNHATTTKDNTDQSADSGNGRTGAKATGNDP